MIVAFANGCSSRSKSHEGARPRAIKIEHPYTENEIDDSFQTWFSSFNKTPLKVHPFAVEDFYSGGGGALADFAASKPTTHYRILEPGLHKGSVPKCIHRGINSCVGKSGI